MKTAQLVILVLGSVGLLGGFFGTPNFNNVVHFGLGAVLSRDLGEVLLFFGMPVVALAQLGLAWAVWKGVDTPLVNGAAWLLCGLDLLVAVGFGALAFALRNFNMH